MNVDIAVSIDIASIASLEPLVGSDCFCSLFWVLPITGHYLCRTNPNFSDFASGAICVGFVVDNANFNARSWSTATTQTMFVRATQIMICRGEVNDSTCCFGKAVCLPELALEHLNALCKNGLTNWRRAIHKNLQTGIILVLSSGNDVHERENCRHEECMSNALFNNEIKNCSRVHFSHHNGCAALHHAGHCPSAATNMEQRHCRHVD